MCTEHEMVIMTRVDYDNRISGIAKFGFIG